LARVQLVECALQFFKLLSSLAELAFRCQALVVGKVFGRFGDERVEIRCGLGRRRGLLALQWPDINFTELTMRVTRPVVDGVVDEVKTEYSEDDLPLDPDLGTVLFNWKRKCKQSEEGWVFPSPVTGRCYHASPIQQDYIRPAGRKLVWATSGGTPFGIPIGLG